MSTRLPIKTYNGARLVLQTMALVILIFCAVTAGVSTYIRYEVKRFIEDVRQLDAASDPDAYFASFKTEHRNQFVGEQCDSHGCYDEFSISNRILSAFHLAPRTEIIATFILVRNSPTSAGIQFTSAIFKQNSPVVYIQEDFCGDRTDGMCRGFYLNPHGRDVAQTWNGVVEFQQGAAQEQKQVAWGLNVQCLTLLHGCTDISKILPTIWKTTKPGTVSSRVRSNADSIAEQSQPLPE